MMNRQDRNRFLIRAAGPAVGSIVGNLASRYLYAPRNNAMVVAPKPMATSSKLGQRLYTRKPVRYVKAKKGKPNLKKRLSQLEKSHRDTMSKLIYKYDTKDTIRVAAGTAGYGFKSAVSGAIIESAIANCRYFDPSNPGTLITASLATPTYKQNILVSARSQMIIKNNYQVPCVVTYGVVFPKLDTSIDPTTAFQNGMADVGNPDNTSTLLSYKDSPQYRDLWRGKLKSKVLKPGGQIILKHFQKGFTYDPSLPDSHSQSYQKNSRSALFVYRIQGVLGHDTSVATEQGLLPAGIDVYIATNYLVTYDSGGASIRTVVLSENATQTFTNGGLTSEQPVADNIQYSIT